MPLSPTTCPDCKGEFPFCEMDECPVCFDSYCDECSEEHERECAHKHPEMVRCSHPWHEWNLAPVEMDACPECDALPAVSVKRDWKEPPTRREKVARSIAGNMNLDPELGEILLRLHVGTLQDDEVYVQQLTSLRLLQLVYCSGMGTRVAQWKLTDAGEAMVRKLSPPKEEAVVEREPIQVTVAGEGSKMPFSEDQFFELTIKKPGEKEYRTGLKVPAGTRVEVVDAKEGLLRITAPGERDGS